MKAKIVPIACIVLWIIVNSKYFWQGYPGFFEMFLFLLLIISFLVLAAACLWIGVAVFRNRLRDRRLSVYFFISFSALATIYLKPNGIIPWDRFFHGDEVFMATREGAAHCSTTIRLFKDNRFQERGICFGYSEADGNYTLKGDTIYFTNKKTKDARTGNTEGYDYAVIRKDTAKNAWKNGWLLLYSKQNPKPEYGLFIMKNMLKFQ